MADIDSIQIDKEPKIKKEEVKLSETDQRLLVLKNKAAGIIDYRCKMRLELYDGSTINALVICKAPDKLRASYTVTSNAQDMGLMEVKAVSNGEVFWLYYPQLNMASKDEVKNQDSIAPGMDELMPDALLGKLNDSNAVYIGEDKIAGVQTDCFEVALEGEVGDLSGMGQAKDIEKYKMYFSKDNGFLMKNIGYGKDGKILFINTTRDVETNISIQDEEFYFTPPEGVQVIDAKTLASMGGM
jgi:outer membrane lipoprotein-sorting protein